MLAKVPQFFENEILQGKMPGACALGIFRGTFRRLKNYPVSSIGQRWKVGLLANHGDFKMLYYALVFLIVAIIAGVLGFGGIAGTSAGIAQVLFGIFVILLLVSLVRGLAKR